MTETVRVRALVRGRVQGVGFRWATAREAERLGVSGFVRNLADGTVEAQAEGAGDAVDALLEFLGHGPPPASVSGVHVEHLSVRGGVGFSAID